MLLNIFDIMGSIIQKGMFCSKGIYVLFLLKLIYVNLHIIKTECQVGKNDHFRHILLFAFNQGSKLQKLLATFVASQHLMEEIQKSRAWVPYALQVTTAKTNKPQSLLVCLLVTAQLMDTSNNFFIEPLLAMKNGTYTSM